MGSERNRQRCRERIEKLAEADLGSDELRQEAAVELAATLGFRRWCWPFSDPVSLLGHSGQARTDYWKQLPRMIVLDQYTSESARAVVARNPRPVVSLHATTRGDLARDPRWRECQSPFGMGDEMTVACRDDRGCWGWLQVHRDSDDPPFHPQDVSFMAELAPALGGALRRALSRRLEPSPDRVEPAEPGVLLLDSHLRMTSWTPSVHAWLRSVPGSELCESVGILPTAVYSAAARGLAAQDAGAHPELPGRLRVRSVSGRWMTFDGNRLEGDQAGLVAVTIRASTPQEVIDLLARAFWLTRRESQLLTLLATGLSTRELAEQLFISPYTVKDHLKAIFEKVGVRSRRELLGEIMGISPSEASVAEDLAEAEAAIA